MDEATVFGDAGTASGFACCALIGGGMARVNWVRNPAAMVQRWRENPPPALRDRPVLVVAGTEIPKKMFCDVYGFAALPRTVTTLRAAAIFHRFPTPRRIRSAARVTAASLTSAEIRMLWLEWWQAVAEVEAAGVDVADAARFEKLWPELAASVRQPEPAYV